MRVLINKSVDKEEQKRAFELKNIQPSFVSWVTAGANRQNKFQVVKTDETEDLKPPGGVSDEKEKGKAPGKKKPKPCKIDMAEWLSSAGARLDTTLSNTLLSDQNVDKTVGQYDLERLTSEDKNDIEPGSTVGKSNDEPSAKELIAKTENLEKALETERTEKADLETKLAKRDKVVQTLKKENVSLKSTVSRLKSGIVGGSTSLMTGNLGEEPDKGVQGDPIDTPWAAGGDMSKKVEQQEKKKN